MSKPHEGREPLIEDLSRKAQMNPTARQQRFEVLIGILGFFTFVALVTTVVAEVQGKAAFTEAAVLAVFVLATFFAIRAWNRR